MHLDRRLTAVIAVILALVQAMALAAPGRPGSFRSDVRGPQRGTGRPAVPGQLVVGLRPESAFALKSRSGATESFRQRWGASLQASPISDSTNYLVSVSQIPSLGASASEGVDVDACAVAA